MFCKSWHATTRWYTVLFEIKRGFLRANNPPNSKLWRISVLFCIATNVTALFAGRNYDWIYVRWKTIRYSCKINARPVKIRRCKVFQGGIFRWVPRLSLFFPPYNRRLAWEIAEYRMRHLSMQACVYGILSICRYSSSIFPADFPRARKIRVNLNSMRSRRRSPRLVSDARDLSLILNRFSLDQDRSHLPAWYIDKRHGKSNRWWKVEKAIARRAKCSRRIIFENLGNFPISATLTNGPASKITAFDITLCDLNYVKFLRLKKFRQVWRIIDRSNYYFAIFMLNFL